MAQLKTTPNDQSVNAFLDGIQDETKRRDSYTLLALMAQVTGQKLLMWGGSIVDFGRYHYHYASGREGNWFLTGFYPRAQNLTLYIMSGFSGFDDLMSKLGKHTTGKSCLYLKRLADIDLDVLSELIKQSVDHMAATNA
jgi:hypothetical protein